MDKIDKKWDGVYKLKGERGIGEESTTNSAKQKGQQRHHLILEFW
jgi:hypothetical protein